MCIFIPKSQTTTGKANMKPVLLYHEFGNFCLCFYMHYSGDDFAIPGSLFLPKEKGK